MSFQLKKSSLVSVCLDTFKTIDLTLNYSLFLSASELSERLRKLILSIYNDFLSEDGKVSTIS